MYKRMAAIACAGVAMSASADVIDFSSLSHGEIVNSQFSSMGVNISAINFNQSFDLAVAFDTSLNGTADPDLEGPWSMGNTDLNTALGNVLIIQENDDIDPDDEGGRPAGQLIFDFDMSIQSFGFTVVDVEDSTSENSIIEFFSGGSLVGSINFDQFEAGGSNDFGAIYGNNSINLIGELSPGANFDQVVITAGGSMGFDNISFTVPAPGSLALFGLGVGALARRRR
jgi:hypothetical protein